MEYYFKNIDADQKHLIGLDLILPNKPSLRASFYS